MDRIDDGEGKKTMDVMDEKTEEIKTYSPEYVRNCENAPAENRPGKCFSRYDSVTKQWRMRIQLDEERIWFLSVFVRDDGSVEKYSLDKELAEDSHYEFSDEKNIRKRIYQPQDENRFFHEILIRYLNENGGEKLLRIIEPYITAQYHFD